MGLSPYKDRLALPGGVVAALCMMALGLWTGADMMRREYFMWDGLPPSLFLQFFGRLPGTLGLLLYAGAVLGMAATFLRKRWWIFGLGAYLLWLITHAITFAIVDARLGHFRETAAGANEPLALLLVIFPPPVFAAGLAWLINRIGKQKEWSLGRQG